MREKNLDDGICFVV